MNTQPPIWITGAHGFIGQRLAAHCARHGRIVAGLGHGAWPSAEAAARGVRHWINGDITSSNLHSLAAAGGAPAVIFHLAGGSSVGAAIGQPGEDFARTVASTAALLEWVRLACPATRIVVASSAAVYGAGHAGPISEQATARPLSPYGFHKLMMEDLCRSYASNYGIAVAVARLFSVYGAGLRKQLLWDLCCQLQRTTTPVELGGDGQESRDWVEVADAVAVLERLADMADPAAPVLNVGTGRSGSVAQVASLVIDAWQESALVRRTLSFNGMTRPGDPRSLVADTGRLAARGLACSTSVEAGVRKYVQWFRSAAGIAS